ncbi:MAG: hypothetical protein U1A27_13895 [Phycisphaerae bacterium]
MKRFAGISLISVVGLFTAGCGQQLGQNPGGGGTDQTQPSESRLNAARIIVDPSLATVDLMQRSASPMQMSCDPLGTQPGDVRWSSRIGGPKTMDFFQGIPPFNPIGAYDFLFTDGETDYIMSMRVPNPAFDPTFTQIEFNFRAVNRFTVGHAFNPTSDNYNDPQANFPSNDDVLGHRSLIDLNGGDVAIEVRGLDFVNQPVLTRAYMNFLGPTAWLLFMRDNGFQSGRFYNLIGASKGGPVAYADVPPPGPPPHGFFQSAQVTGDRFDVFSEPANRLDPPNALVHPCNELPSQPYAFIDRSNLSADNPMPPVITPAPGHGGFLLVIRREAFHTGPANTISQVVLDPSGPRAPIVNGVDTIPAPKSGYNEPALVPLFVQIGPHVTNHAPGGIADGVAGVHELAISVFFIHIGGQGP